MRRGTSIHSHLNEAPSPHLTRPCRSQFCSEASCPSLALAPRREGTPAAQQPIMPCASELVHGEGGTIKVGSTGTIGSLMTKELEAIKVTPQAVTTPRLRCQGCPVSVPCGANPRKIVLRKSSSNVTSNISNNGRTDRVSAEESCKTRKISRRHTFNSPILYSDGVLADLSPNTEKVKKKGNRYGVEVVDVKCSNPMSSRLRKLGFSKLSETFA